MKIKEQKVEIYSDIYYAKINMNRNIRDGWFVRTCEFDRKGECELNGILVIYERLKEGE